MNFLCFFPKYLYGLGFGLLTLSQVRVEDTSLSLVTFFIAISGLLTFIFWVAKDRFTVEKRISHLEEVVVSMKVDLGEIRDKLN
jgi:hypothetical protein